MTGNTAKPTGEAPHENRRTEQPGWEGRILPGNTGRNQPTADAGERAASTANGAAVTEEAGFDAEDLPERSPSGGALWFWWTVATMAGWALVGAIAGAVFGQSDASPWPYVVLPLSALFQWLLLRRHFARASWWLLASTAGAAVAGLIYAGLLALPAETFGPPTSGLRSSISDLADGIALATAQWLVLRRTVRGAAWWFPAAMVPFILFALLDFQRGLAAAEVVENISRSSLIGLAAANTGLLGLLLGALTGFVLARLVESSS
jgi:hypothetical protein